MNEIIYLEIDEEITSVIDKLRKSESSGTALVIPRGANLTQSIVNLKLLKKSADDMNKEISIVSNDRISRNLASQIGITVYSKVSEAEKAKPEAPLEVEKQAPSNDSFKINSYYQKKKEEEEAEDVETDEEPEEVAAEELNMEDYDDKEEVIAREEAEQISEKLPEEKFVKKPLDNKPMSSKPTKNMSGSRKILIGIIAASVLVILAAGFVFLPSAKVSILVKTDNLSVEEEVKVDPVYTSYDKEKLIIPGKTVDMEKEISKTFTATGIKKDPLEKAKGSITVSNAWDNNSITLEKGTKFTSGGKVFVSLEAVTVPGIVTVAGNNVPGSKAVSVEAENAGEEYNIGPSSFVISGLTPSTKQNYIKGTSSAAMTGGTTKITHLVQESDIANGEAELLKDAKDSNKTELISLGEKENYKIFNDKIKVETKSKTSSKNVGDEAENFDLRLNVRISILGFSMDDVKKLSIDLAKDELSEGSMLINPEKADIEVSLPDKINADSDVETISFNYQAKYGKSIDLDSIKKQIKGKKSANAQKIVESVESVESSEVKVWPSNLFRIPYFVKRINIDFDYSE